MKVHIPSPLLEYTGHKTPVEASGKTLWDLLHDLESRHAGFLFRVIDEQGGIREHIRFFRGEELTQELDVSLAGVHEIHIICALSGG
ncbi:MAG: molybdopterin synthase sulfur carrier subunit [Candidatus Paceibacteria bacterium]